MGIDGHVLSQGSMSDALTNDQTLVVEVIKENLAIEKTEGEVDSQVPAGEIKKGDGKLTVAEEIEEGHVSWPACTYLPCHCHEMIQTLEQFGSTCLD